MMPLGARRTFRLASVVALSLAIAYGLDMPLPFFAPLFGLLLTATPGPPLGVKGLLGLTLVVMITLGIGLVLTPLLGKYPLPALLIIACGLYFATVVTVGMRKDLVGALLAVGFTLIPAAGLVEYALAVTLIKALLLGIAVAIVSQLIVYPFFPEDAQNVVKPTPPPVDAEHTRWIAARAVVIVLPPVLMAFSNPALYLPMIMKTVLLSQQGSVASARTAGRDLLGAVFLAGVIAILFWFALKILPNLWMFFLLMLLFGIYFAARIYRVTASRFSAPFWIDVVINLLILLGPAVEDSANGKDPYKAFAVRFSLFVAVTLYAWAAIVALEWLRARRRGAQPVLERVAEAN
ncbi:MAG: DUF2955 domain-containing protein [Pseudomonadota bacterium]|nr:DUF2955 domain-containing protein [Pseudomonadota bacterium]